jgi:hypothetical protein
MRLFFTSALLASVATVVAQDTCNNDCVNKRDWVTSTGLGDSPGVPGVEYLGLGYNIFEGNPRGTGNSELDPGFRHRVINLVMDQNLTTMDTDYMKPFGVRVLSASSCQFSSTSVEISNEEQYTNDLKSEVSTKTSIDVSAQGNLKGVPVKFSSSLAFSRSENFEKYSQSTSKTQSVLYEAKAICTEFDLSLGKRAMVDDSSCAFAPQRHQSF